MNVLSLFDGMSCGHIALERSNIEVDNYFACEIDKNAIKVTQANYPNTIQLGNVLEVNGSRLPNIDLLIGGSPCQGFSFAGNQLNFNDPRSKLFFEFVRLLKEVKPKYFLLENVKMKKEYQNIITKSLGVEPIEINSNLVSAQNRKRLYWTNIPNITHPEDKKIYLKDIINTDKIIINYSSSGRGGGVVESRIKEAVKSYTLTKTGFSARSITGVAIYPLPHGFNTGGVFNREKMPTLRISGQHNYFYINNEKFRKLTVNEWEALQTVPVDYTKYVSEPQRFRMLGNGWTVDVLAHIFKGLSQSAYFK